MGIKCLDIPLPPFCLSHDKPPIYLSLAKKKNKRKKKERKKTTQQREEAQEFLQKTPKTFIEGIPFKPYFKKTR